MVDNNINYKELYEKLIIENQQLKVNLNYRLLDLKFQLK